MRSSLEAGFVSQGAAAQRRNAGMIADGAGAGIKLGGRALLERIRKTREEHPEILLAAHEKAVKKDLGVLPGEAWSWIRHCYEAVLPHCSRFRSLKRICALLAAALDEGRTGSLERQQALLCQMYTVCESAAKDPSHDLAWGWPVLSIRDPKGRAQPGWLPAESAAVIAFHRENAALESAKKALSAPKQPDRNAEEDVGKNLRAGGNAAGNQKGKGKDKDGENPA